MADTLISISLIQVGPADDGAGRISTTDPNLSTSTGQENPPSSSEPCQRSEHPSFQPCEGAPDPGLAGNPATDAEQGVDNQQETGLGLVGAVWEGTCHLGTALAEKVTAEESGHGWRLTIMVGA